MRLLHAVLAAVVFIVSAGAATASPSLVYDQLEWSDPLNKMFVTLGNDDFLITGGRAFEIWNARSRARRPATGWPNYTGIGLPWARLDGGTLVSGRTRGGGDKPVGSLIWWSSSADRFSAPLTLPLATEIDALIRIDGTLALVCMRSGFPGGTKYTEEVETLPRRAAVVDMQAGTPRWASAPSSWRARLLAAGVRGPVEGAGLLEQDDGKPAPPLSFDTTTCEWRMRDQPAELTGTVKQRINFHYLPQGRVIVVRAEGFVPGTGFKRMITPRIWDSKTSAWTAIAPPSSGQDAPDIYRNVGPADPIVALASAHVDFLNPSTLRWERSAQTIDGGDVPLVAPISTGAVAIFQYGKGKVLVANPPRDAPEPRLVAVKGSPFPAPVAMPPLELHGPARSPLSPAEVAAIETEALRRYRQEEPFAAPWETLDRHKLARLMHMPAFPDLYALVPLLDTAAAWELMPFDRPSEVQANWHRWLPRKGIADAMAPDERYAITPPTYHADGRWGPVAGAQIALVRCLPATAWRVKHMDPMLWSLERHGRWYPEYKDFGGCVRQQGDDGGDGYVPTVRGRLSAGVLEDKLSKYLLAHGCTGTGPDSCLIVLNALVSLNSAHPALPTILERLNRALDMTRSVALPSLSDSDRTSRAGAAFTQLKQARYRIIERQIFLSEKMSVLLAQPHRFPADEWRSVLAAARTLDQLFQRAADSAGQRLDELGRDPDMQPAQRLHAARAMPLRMQTQFSRLGARAARKTGCKITPELEDMPPHFWYAYVDVKLTREKRTCGRLPGSAGAAKLYQAGLEGAAPELVRALKGLRKFLQRPGPARQDMLAALAPGCPSEADPWNVCRDLARANALAEKTAERARARKLRREEIEELKEGRCSQSHAEHAGQFLGIDNSFSDEDSPVVASACRSWPADKALIIAAFAYDVGEEKQRNLLVALLDRRSGKVLASYQSRIEEGPFTDADASLQLDIRRHGPADAARAFGLTLSTGEANEEANKQMQFIRAGDKLVARAREPGQEK